MIGHFEQEGEDEERDSRFDQLIFMAPYSDLTGNGMAATNGIMFEKFDDEIMTQFAKVSLVE
jgi:hypothetical protein